MIISRILLFFTQTFLLVLLAPLLSGIIRKIKNNLRMRKGPSIFQPYYNLAKLFSKDEVVSKNTSWIFAFTPIAVLASMLVACFLIPVFSFYPSFNAIGDLLLIFFIFAFARFFQALAGLDAGSSFGGMGSSREVFISSIAEPTAFVSLFVIGINCGSTAILTVSATQLLKVSTLFAGFSFFMILITETSRIPVDNQETHLELTMVHEAMLLEYSGRSLAFIELASQIKQLLLFIIFSWFLFPAFVDPKLTWFEFPLRILIICGAVAVVEVSLAKMRLFRVVDFMGFAFFIALLAAVIACLGL